MVAACFAVTAALSEAFFSFGIFFKPLESEFGWSRSLISSGFTAFIIGYCISVTLSGRLADRYPPRFILIVSALLAGLGLALCSRLNSVDQLRVFLFIAGLGSGATLSVPTSTVQRWFLGRANAGTALAVVLSGVGVGQLTFPPLINHFILNYGWRNAYLITGIIFFAIILVSSFVIRANPEKTAEIKNTADPKQPRVKGRGSVKVMAKLTYAGIVYAACVSAIANQAVTVHFVPHATDLGMTSTAAAAALGFLGGLSIPSRVLSGFLSDRIGWRNSLFLSFIGITVALAMLSFIRSVGLLYIVVFLYGASWGIRAVAQLGILSEFFGLRSVGALIGLTIGISSLVGAFAPYAVGLIYDITGTYQMAFITVTVLLFSGGLAVILVKRPPVPPD